MPPPPTECPLPPPQPCKPSFCCSNSPIATFSLPIQLLRNKVIRTKLIIDYRERDPNLGALSDALPSRRNTRHISLFSVQAIPINHRRGRKLSFSALTLLVMEDEGRDARFYVPSLPKTLILRYSSKPLMLYVLPKWSVYPLTPCEMAFISPDDTDSKISAPKFS